MVPAKADARTRTPLGAALTDEDVAQARNRLVLPLLSARLPMPLVLPNSYSPGREDEAIVCAEQIIDGWNDTPGALEWLDAIIATQSPPRRARGTSKAKAKPKPKPKPKTKRPKQEPPGGESKS